MDRTSHIPTCPLIDYQKIADGINYYSSLGYSELPVPWIIGFDAYNATRPPDRREFYTLGGYLVASGEQSFLDLMLSGTKLTKHFSITPCFRDEPDLDEYHHNYFLKLELIIANATHENLIEMIQEAKSFLDRYIPVPSRIICTHESEQAYDIVDGVHGIELGSYGIRTYKGISWIYGTGIALPRLDTVIRNTHS